MQLISLCDLRANSEKCTYSALYAEDYYSERKLYKYGNKIAFEKESVSDEIMFTV